MNIKVIFIHILGSYDEGCNAWGGGGTITLCTGVGEELLEKGNCEEVFVHEGCHVSLDYEMNKVRESFSNVAS